MLTAQPASPPIKERASAGRWAICFVVLLASAQIAIPLSESHEAPLTGITVLFLGLSTCFFARSSTTYERITWTFLVVGALALAVEALGVQSGWPFGRYHYSHLLSPRLFGVPVIVPLAWFAMTLAAREVARHLLERRWSQLLATGYLLAAWDLFLDPQMTRAGFWVWNGSGDWQGIPFSNYLGWLVVGTVLAGVADLLLGQTQSNKGLVFVFFWMSFMATIGNLLPFAFDRPEVGLVGGIATLPLVVPVLARRAPSWLASPS